MLSVATPMSRGDSMTLLELAYDSNMASLPSSSSKLLDLPCLELRTMPQLPIPGLEL